MLLMAASLSIRADGTVVDKVYHPIVLPNEHRVEWRFMSRQTEEKNILAQRIGYGQSLSETVTVEFYLLGERDRDDNFGIEAYELESRWMITEQGRYWADWGMVFELEKRHGLDAWEASAGLLMEKEFGRNSLTLNWFSIYEWGNDIQDEWEGEFRMQYRFRWKPQVQPSLELFVGEDFVGIGPALMGIQRFEAQKQLKWELGFISELSGVTKDHTLRFVLEYEF
ncbi:hypothetical protein P2G88_03305 [Aliiglaciecola sp. CAU 1673]|uniref:hypothetical protein n=1 Tax=Aliiglaciecola sp. CAU 1673 TaxID=3032595 RepID=UPI0023DC4D57|nr:hypothetical protein [Aliiglaciecola sp. CAU 1673]MDF2177269.1 hypothetical protein [Aliiglaciecola sp. CAU 1673]